MLFTSLDPETTPAKQVVSYYRRRMQIEESFRDLKNTRNGLSLRHCRSFSIERLNVALLLSSIATLGLWVMGVACQQSNRVRDFQANTVRHRAVLSNFTIGWQALHRAIPMGAADYDYAIGHIKHAAACNLDN